MRTHGIKVVRTRLAQHKMMLVGRWLFVKPGYTLTQQDYTHEAIHLAQQRELAYVGFYLWYAVEFLVKLRLARNWQRAYRSVSFEREAYAFEGWEHWLEIREGYYWMRFLWKIGQ